MNPLDPPNPSFLLASSVQDRALPESRWDGLKAARFCFVPGVRASSRWGASPSCQSGLHFLCFPRGQVAACTTSGPPSVRATSARPSRRRLSRGRLVPSGRVQAAPCLQQNWGATRCQPGPCWEQSKTESFLPRLRPRCAVISYLIYRSSLFTFFLRNYGFAVLFLPLKELLGMTLPSNNRGRGLRCVNLHPVADQNVPWCLFTAHQFRHQLRSYSLLNVDKSPCIKFNLRFIRRDLKQERHLSRNWKKILLTTCY